MHYFVIEISIEQNLAFQMPDPHETLSRKDKFFCAAKVC